MTAPTCGLENCAATAVARYRIRPRSTRSLFDAAPKWMNACSGHLKNIRELGQVLTVENLSTDEPERIVWPDEEPKKEEG